MEASSRMPEATSHARRENGFRRPAPNRPKKEKRLAARGRRFTVRLALVCFGVCPTFGLLAWAGARTALYNEFTYAASLTAWLGLDCHMKACQHESPFTVTFRGMHLADPETHSPLADCSHVRWDATPGRPAIALDGVALHRRSLPALWRAFHDRLFIGAGRSVIPSQIEASIVRLADASGETALRAVRFQRVPGESGIQWLGELHVGGESPPTNPPTLLVKVERRRDLEPPTTKLEIDARQTPLPVGLVIPAGAEAEALGAEAHFRGSLWMDESLEGRETEVVGSVSQVDLASLVKRFDLGDARGTVHAKVVVARWAHGRLTELDVLLYGSEGAISGETLARLASRWRLQIPRELDGRANWRQSTYLFDQLDLRVRISDSGTSILPGKPNQARVVLRHGEQPLLVAPGGNPKT